MRECGMLLPIASLPSKYGIGCFSKEAYEFVDQLKEGGQGPSLGFSTITFGSNKIPLLL